MSTDKSSCQSCTMPIESGTYCQYCADEAGNLHAFEETFERMLQWSMKENPGLNAEQAEQQTLAFMAERPAWREHPELLARRA